MSEWLDATVNESMLTVASVFRPVYTTIVLPDTQKLTRPFDRKTAVVSLTKTLADSKAFVQK